MELKFLKTHLSINQFDPVEIPDFTVITGRNGSGKTQILQSIKNGCCQVDEVPVSSIRYFSGTDFQLDKQVAVSRSQATQRFNQILSIFNGQSGNPKVNFRSIAQQIWQKNMSIPLTNRKETSDVDWSRVSLFEKSNDLDIEILLKNYREEIQERILTPLETNLDGASLATSIQSTPGPVHNVQLTTHFGTFTPETSNRGILNTSLGTLFSQYKVNQYNWARRQSEELDSPLKFSELLKEYEENHKKPWNLVNDIFKQMNTYSDDDNVFSFDVTNPDDQSVNYRNVDSFAFSPQVRDRKTGAIFGFESLSSGESVLAALCVSLLEMEQAGRKPKVLLFDEIEASLHPSMTTALLETIKISFVDQGVSVILATHSPSTVALADPDSLFLVEPKSPAQKLKKVNQGEATKILTEGLASFSDAKLIFKGMHSALNIITEGHNAIHIKKYIELSELKDVSVIEGLEARSGKSQLHTYAQLLNCIKLEQSVLIVLDSDAGREFDQIEESDRVKKFKFAKRQEGYSCGGIENMFERSILEPFLHIKTITEHGSTREYRELQDYCKRNFETHIRENANLGDFVHFASLGDMIQSILNQ